MNRREEDGGNESKAQRLPLRRSQYGLRDAIAALRVAVACGHAVVWIGEAPMSNPASLKKKEKAEGKTGKERAAEEEEEEDEKKRKKGCEPFDEQSRPAFFLPV